MSIERSERSRIQSTRAEGNFISLKRTLCEKWKLGFRSKQSLSVSFFCPKSLKVSYRALKRLHKLFSQAIAQGPVPHHTLLTCECQFKLGAHDVPQWVLFFFLKNIFVPIHPVSTASRHLHFLVVLIFLEL